MSGRTHGAHDIRATDKIMTARALAAERARDRCRARRRAGHDNNPVLRTEGRVTVIDCILGHH